MQRFIVLLVLACVTLIFVILSESAKCAELNATAVIDFKHNSQYGTHDEPYVFDGPGAKIQIQSKDNQFYFSVGAWKQLNPQYGDQGEWRVDVESGIFFDLF